MESEAINDEKVTRSENETRELEETRSPQRVKSKRQKIVQIIFLLLALFSVLCCYSMIAPFFPQEAMAKGLTSTEIGIIFAFFPAVTFVMAPIYGFFIVQLSAKFLCVAGCFLCGGCCVLFGLLGYVKDRNTLLAVALVIRGVEGNGSTMLNVAAASLVLKSFPEKTGMMSSLIEGATALGFLAGPSLGAAFFAIGGYSLPFWAMGGVTLLTSLLLFIILDKSDELEPKKQNFFRLFYIPGMSVMFLQFVTTSLVMTFLNPVLGGFITQKFGLSSSIVGLIFSTWSISYLIVSPLWGKIVDKGFVYSTMIFGVFTSGVAFMLLAPSPLLDTLLADAETSGLVVLACVLEGFFTGAMYIPSYLATLNLAEVNGYKLNEQTYGLVSGMMNSGNSLGSIGGPLLSGYLTDKYGFAWATTIMAFTLLAMGVVEIIFVVTMRLTGSPLVLPKSSELEEKEPLLS
ncbi:MFS-type transporter SLC18B1-like [Watersipora subatra]|uniref:MFS-type transporter SLC18B1-like n=1 Tax=Watersipora subatra TaxID=2589382 RepID=UPI00355BD0C0